MMRILVHLILLISPILLSAQVETVFNQVQFYESVDVVQKKLKTISESSEIISVVNPSFPLAKEKETHLICANVKTVNGVLEKVVFTFADDKLNYIEAKGNAIKTLINKRKDTARSYLDYKVYFSELLFGNTKKDIVWMLTKEAAHPNLFTWENPYLNNKKTNHNYEPSAKIPDFIEMGASIDKIKPILETKSSLFLVQQLDGSDPNAQTQLNCFGIEYAGFPRKIEARFGDGKLNVVWILTGKGEEDRIRQKLKAAYGEPIYTNKDWEIFNDWQVGLRKDKPEVLVLTKELGQHYKKEFFKQ